MKQHKHCMCKHKQKLESKFTIISAVPPVVGNSIISADEKPSLARQCATNWWKLKLSDRKAHNEFMKIQLLSPFLFCKVYQGDPWVYFAKKTGLLSEQRIDSLNDLSDEEIHNVDLLERAITELQEKIIEYNNIKPNKPIYTFLEEILDDIKEVEDTFQSTKKPLGDVETAIKIVDNKHWFKSVRKQLPAACADKHDYALFLVAWQVSFYIKTAYQEKPLDVYKNATQLDSALEVYKQQGNEYFKNEEYNKAIKTYTTILCKKPYLHIIYGNRAACYLKKQKYRLALSDGRRAVALSPHWDKGQYRYAQALYELGKYEETLNVLSKASKLCASAQLISLQRDVKRTMAERSSRVILENPHEPVSRGSADGNTVKDYADEQQYANMPDLETDNSDIEEQSDNDNEERIVTPPIKEDMVNTRSECKKENSKKKRKKKTKAHESKTIMQFNNICKNEVMTIMKGGSTYLLDAKPELAIREYCKVICMIQSEPDIISSKDGALLHFSLGWAYQGSGLSFLQDSLRQFEEINRKYPDLKFPLSFYGKGLVYHKQNRFKESIAELNEALQLCSAADCMLNCCWAGVDNIIEVSIPENFKLAIDHFLNLCYNPPRPDAICRHHQCNNRTVNIYFTDPDYKGFLRLICTENCFVEFHSSCWKRYKSEEDNHSVERDFLTLPCLTPDCFGVIWSLQVYDNSKNKKIPKEINVKDVNSLKKELAVLSRQRACRQKRLPNHGAHSSDKKRRKDSPLVDRCDGETADQHFSLAKDEKQKHYKRSSSLSEKDSDLDDCAKHRNVESRSISSDTLENNHHKNTNDGEPTSCSQYFRSNFDISQYSCIADAHSIATNIIKAFEKLLLEKGSVDLSDGAGIQHFMDKLDDDCKLLVFQVGSLRTLLAASPKLSFDDKDINKVYLLGHEKGISEQCVIPKCPLTTQREKKKSESSDKYMTNEVTAHTEEKTDIVNHVDVIDCTEGKANDCSNKLEKKRGVNDIIIPKDDETDENLKSKVIGSSDKGAPRKKGKAKDKTFRKIDDNIYQLMHGQLMTSAEAESNLQTYLEEKIHAERNKQTKYGCSLLDDNCSCTEIERFCDEDGGKTRVIIMEPGRKESDSDVDSNQTVADVLELIQNGQNNVHKRVKRSSSCENVCVGEVGIQCDLTNLKKIEAEKGQLKGFNEDLIKRLKDSQVSSEKLSDDFKKYKEKQELDFKKYKEKQELVIENKNAEIKSHKSSIEKLKKELLLVKNTSENEVNKLKNEHATKVETLSRHIDSLDKEKCHLQVLVNDNARTEVEQVSNLSRKNAEVKAIHNTCEVLRKQIKEMQNEYSQEKATHEDIVNRLSSSVTEQCNRTQKVQIAFLEIKKEIVAVKYQQQAAVVQNTINQMQFWPMIPEVQNIRSIWDDFKKHFQSCYEKMQEEFKVVTQKVRDGEPLEELPPAQYAEPPPFPKTPMPNNVPLPSPYFGQHSPKAMTVPASGYQLPSPLPFQSGLPSPLKRSDVTLDVETTSSDSTVTSTELTPSIDSKSPRDRNKSTSCAAVSPSVCIGVFKANPLTTPVSVSSAHSASPVRTSTGAGETKILSFASSVKQGCGSDHQTFSSSPVNLKASAPKHAIEPSLFSGECDDSDEPRRNMYDRIITRLGSIFPSLSREELRFYVVEYRRTLPQGSLSGVKFDELISNLEKMIRAMKAAANAPQNAGAYGNSKMKTGAFPFAESVESSKAGGKRIRANQMRVKDSKELAWSGTVSKSGMCEVYGEDEPCVICYEVMYKGAVSKLHCGHVFHRSCITCWLHEQRTCPICRVHALLPEEYPTLA